MSVTFTAGTPTVLDGYTAVVTHTGAPELTLANGNAADLLQLLGYPTGDGCGEADPADFTGRVLVAQALLDVATDDTNGRSEVTDGCWTDGGRRPGYLADRLNLLAGIARWAAEHDGVVVWH